MLIRIESPYFVAGATVDDNYCYCQKAAPIIKYMKGWHMTGIINYCKKKKWKYTITQEVQKDE